VPGHPGFPQIDGLALFPVIVELNGKRMVMIPVILGSGDITSARERRFTERPGIAEAMRLGIPKFETRQIGPVPWEAMPPGDSCSRWLRAERKPADQPPHSPWLTSSEAAQYLRYKSTQGVRDAVARGELKASRRGRTLLFHLDDLDAYLRSRSISPKYCGPTEAATQREGPMVRPTTRKPEVPHEGTSGEDPYNLRAALTDDQAERDPEPRHRAGRQRPSQPTPKEKQQ
jgi:excisionase family DNA binding protein